MISGKSVGRALPTRDEFRALIRLALPIATVQVGIMSLGVVDTLMVGQVSAVELAGVALGNLYFFLIAVFGMGLLFVLDPLVSQAHGAGDGEGVARAVQRGALLATGLAVLASFFLWPGEWVLRTLGQPPEVAPIAGGYARATIPGMLPFYLFVVARQSLQAMGRVAPIVWTLILGNAANVLFNWVLVYGMLGVPELGAVGAGWASSLTRFGMAGVLLALAWPRLRPCLIPLRPAALQTRPLGRMVRLGAPIGAQMALEFGAFAIAGLLVGLIGTVEVGAHQIALNLAALTFMVPLGVGQATAVLVGQGVGAGLQNAARRASVAGLVVGVGFMCLTAVIFLSVPELLVDIFTQDPAVLALAASLLPIAGVFQVADGVQVVCGSILRGIGDTRVPMLLNLVGFFAVGLPSGVLFAFPLGMGARGVWWGLALGLGVVAILLSFRARSRLSAEVQRILVDDEPAIALQGSSAQVRAD